MSNDLASESLSMPSNQMGQLEPISNKLESSIQMGLMGSGTGGSLQQVSVTNMQFGPVAPGYSVSASQQKPVSNMQMGMLLPMSNNPGSEILPVSNQQTFQMEPQAYNLVQQQFFLPDKQMGGLGTMSNSLASQQFSSLNKRKAPMEPVSNNSLSPKPLMSNKRVAQPEHRPWLQQTSGPDRRVVQQMQFMPNSPGSQNSPTLNKKVVPKESATSKPGPRKQSIPKSQNTPLQPSSKLRTESFESVRSKMRESLASALALVSQLQDKSLKEEKNGQNEAENILRKTEENSQTAGSSPTASCAVEPVSEERKETLPSQEGSSAPLCFDNQNASQGYFANENITNSSQMSKSNGQEFQYGNFLPDEDVPFSDNFFARDELLQGNGLSWVLEPIEVSVKKEVPAAVKQESGNEQVGGDRYGGQRQSDQSPQILASKIEAELFKLFGGVNKKYKEKGRSLLFNLKDPNNPDLREKVMSGEIPPERLCAMSAEELASKELSEWRMAKAEEFAQMVFLPDEDDTRRLVKKTHKGEVQVEVEQVDAASADVSVGASSLAQVLSKAKKKEVSSPSKAVGMKDGSNTAAADKKSNLEDQERPCSVASPSNEGTDLMEGLMVDNELKDAEFLPPIVSLDEFMESLNTEPPFENLPVDAEKPAGTSDKDDSEVGSESKSPVQTPADPVDTRPAKPDNVDLKSRESEADAKPSDSPVKSETAPSTFVPKGELVWDGLLQLNISAMASVIGIYKSGEKTSGKGWANFLEIKGRVRLEAFEKFLQELPMSRSRAVMILHLVEKEASRKGEHASLSEVADSYVLDGRVGFAEPAPGIELYFCPPHIKTREMVSKILPNDQLEAINAIDNGLIGVVVWRKAQLTSTISPNSASHHKHPSKKHFSSRRHQDKNTNMNVNITPSPKPSSMSQARPPSVYAKSSNDDDDDDDDVPPGFGPPSGRDDDDLPEFNFSGGSAPKPSRCVGMTHFHPHTQTPSRPVDQMRELIQKYGQPQGSPTVDRRGVGVGIQAWNNDDDDDIPEWQPQAPQNQPTHHPVHAYQRTNMDNQQLHYGSPQLHSHQQYRQPNVPQMNVMQSQQNASHLWAHGQFAVPPPAAQPSGVQLYGAGQPGLSWRQDAPKSRGF
ncbi:uncharacterized protein LOC116132989 isoform X1 [Pistacia vera]|uniref:uncharacterized protein LOC116132989 isoform X1 n=1 Tax=Pistacia vera TaxID=55513 RepID=UPI001263DE29|nr:uncharacterized protein LOC116132989 isoform X1 [Pistacia vera]XP_031274529.1 uncharacterized protein LOC116132989 isoform X1 [Pistacia vera]XP_031274531.1 uncharacterized protein LOC116132989 isoform X1 [Pistacia vera]